MKFYQLSEDQLVELIAAEMELAALRQGGVDNWCWCGDSCQDYIDEIADELGLDSKDADFNDLAKREVRLKYKPINQEEV